MQNVSIYQSISTAFPYLKRYQLSVCLSVGLSAAKIWRGTEMPFSIELAYENPKYKSLNTKDKSKKLKVKTQKAKDNKGKKPFWRQNLKHKKQNTKDEVKGPKIKVKWIKKI